MFAKVVIMRVMGVQQQVPITVIHAQHIIMTTLDIVKLTVLIRSI